MPVYLPSEASKAVEVTGVYSLSFVLEKKSGKVGDLLRFSGELKENTAYVDGEIVLQYYSFDFKNWVDTYFWGEIYDGTYGDISALYTIGGKYGTDVNVNVYVKLRVEYFGGYDYCRLRVRDRRSGAVSGEVIVTLEVETALSISAPDRVRVNEEFDVTGRLIRKDTGEGIAGKTVGLWYDTVKVADATTDAGGNYAFKVKIGKAGKYTLKARFEGGTYAPSEASKEIEVVEVPGAPRFDWRPVAVLAGVLGTVGGIGYAVGRRKK
ncbi:MAG: hypothetical protein QXT64_02865 [Desulfurococcaceae archaeon]